MLARLRRSGAAAVALAGAAAALEPADLALVAEAAGLDAAQAEDTADALVQMHLLSLGEQVSFRYPLMRNSVLQALGRGCRQHIHLRAALRRRNAPLTDVAAHLVAAPDPVGESWVIPTLLGAARAAQTRGAPQLAREFLRRSLLEPAPPPVQAQRLIDLGVTELALDPTAAVARLRAAMSLAEQPGDVARACVPLAYALLENESVAAAAGVLDEAIARIGPAAPALADRLQISRLSIDTLTQPAARSVPSRLAQLSNRLGGLPAPAALRSLEAYWASLDADRAGRAEIAATAADALTGTEAHQEVGRYEATLGLGHALVALLNVEEYERVISYCRSQMDHRPTPRLRLAWLHVMRARAESGLGKHPSAATSARTALEMIAHPGEGVGRAVAASSTAALLDSLAELGEYDQASALLVDPWWDGRLSAMPCHYLLLFSRGKLRLATGDAGRASADFRECGRRAREWGLTNPGALPWRSDAAVAAAVLGHGPVGLDLARAEVELARRAGKRARCGCCAGAVGGYWPVGSAHWRRPLRTGSGLPTVTPS